jgi:hypothetical protein
MKNKDFFKDNKLSDKLKALKKKLENIFEQGIVFKINKEKNPTEIIGVLDFLKYKIEKWNNTNIFSYSGNLFGEETVIVIGAVNLKDSVNMITYIFLKEFLANNLQINFSETKLRNSKDIELYLNNEFSDNTKEGLPNYPNLEIEIRKHLEMILKNK